MEKKSSLLQLTLTYGAILGVASIIFSLVLYIAGFIPYNFKRMILTFVISLAISIVFISAGTKAYRDKILGGSITFAQALLVGFGIVLFSTIIGSLYNLIFNTIIDPDYMNRVMEATKNWTYDWMNNMGAPEARIEEAMDRIEKQKEGMSPVKTFFQSFIISAIFGTILSLIIAAFTKKNRNPVA
jgi:uncharacterized membrane protein (DUF106 family)